MAIERSAKGVDAAAAMLAMKRANQTVSAIAVEFGISKTRASELIRTALERERLGPFAELSKPIRDFLTERDLVTVAAVEAALRSDSLKPRGRMVGNARFRELREWLSKQRANECTGDPLDP